MIGTLIALLAAFIAGVCVGVIWIDSYGNEDVKELIRLNHELEEELNRVKNRV